MGDALVQAVGALLVLAAVVDVFHTVYHPAGRGRLSSAVMASVWVLATRLPGGGSRSLAGPVGLVACVGVWAGLLVVGWALVFWPVMPGGFAYGAGRDPARRSGVLDALDVAMTTTTTTLGLGDVVATSTALALATTLSALLGLVLLTSAVSWVLQAYPAPARRRALAARVDLLERTLADQRLDDLEPAVAAAVLIELSQALVLTRVDLAQSPETYYFHDRQRAMSLPAAMGVVLELARAGACARSASVRLGAELLEEAAQDLLGSIALTFLRGAGAGEPAGDLVARYRADHGHRDGPR